MTTMLMMTMITTTMIRTMITAMRVIEDDLKQYYLIRLCFLLFYSII